ncbi:MAG: structural protein [Alphaproteobacteria bacterium]|nr:structural protein [Alphaproteobacteria bacterium]MCK5659283.1 structural protein [Alphaproteobacteria bacterium]
MLSIFLPRGIRNNNPGNIRLSKTVWQGQKPAPQTDKDFVEFTTPLYGLRALMRTLLTYYLKYNLDTVECIINRFAPPHENATDSYIHHIAKSLKVRRTDRIDLTSRPLMLLLARSIVLHENGASPSDSPFGWYEQELYNQAVSLVLPPRNLK